MTSQFKRITDALELRRLGQQLEDLSESADYAPLLQDLEKALPVAAATPDLPLFTVLPTTFEEPARWHDLLSAYPFDDVLADRLFRAGFVPLDREGAEFGVVGDVFPDAVTGRYLLLDSDYATVLLPPEGGPLANRCLEVDALLRYLDHGVEPSAIHSVGAIRGHLGYHGLLTGNYYEPVEVTVSSRGELEDLVARLQGNLADQPQLSVWFRGQTSEYLTDDLTADAERGICPWRSLRDPSLAPSLCRRLTALRDSWREYASFLLEFGRYGTFLEEALDIPAFDARAADDPARQRLGAEWGQLELSGERLDLAEAHDYHFGFRGLQRLFFFQHYGLPSNVLDITNDLDVALFFANHRITDGRYVSVGPDPARVLYMLIVQPGLDHFLDSRDISENFGLLRPLRQSCGLISGASMINRNAYARFVSLRVHLDGDIAHAELTPSHLFPSADEDVFLRRLLEFQEEYGLARIRPFVLAE